MEDISYFQFYILTFDDCNDYFLSQKHGIWIKELKIITQKVCMILRNTGGSMQFGTLSLENGSTLVLGLVPCM